MSKQNKIICLIVVIVLLVTSFCVFMVNYTEYKFKKKSEQIIKEAQKLPVLLKEYDNYKKMGY